MVRIVFGTGTVIARQAHAKLHTPGLPFEACPQCCPAARFEPGRSFGALITDGTRVVDSALAARLLVA